MKKSLMVILAVMVIFFSTNAFAQMVNLKALGISKASPSPVSTLVDLISRKDKLSAAYVQSTRSTASALSAIGGALGLEGQIAGKLPQTQALTPGNISDSSIFAVRQEVGSVSQLIKQKAQGAQTALTADQKQSFQSGLLGLINGMQGVRSLLPQAGSLGQEAQSIFATAPLADKMKVQNVALTALSLAKNIPMDLNVYKGVLASLLQFASSNKIQVPQMASSLLN